jgi:hypothetical protein
MLLYAPSVLTFQNSTFCTQSVLVSFVRPSGGGGGGGGAIFARYAINFFVFITETEIFLGSMC